MKRYGLVAVVLSILVGIGAPASALTMLEVGSVDLLRYEADLGNSGDATELAWVREKLNDPLLVMSEKYPSATSDWSEIGSGAGIFALELMDSPSYYLLKFGNGLGTDDGNTHFLFENLEELTYAVVRLSDLGAARIDEIRGISHVDEFGGGGGGGGGGGFQRVPEPATLLLLGSGLLGLGLVRRRKAQR